MPSPHTVPDALASTFALTGSTARRAPCIRPILPLAVADEVEEFFEKRIRPVLVDDCHECHSGPADELSAELDLPNRAGLITGGESGPALAALQLIIVFSATANADDVYLSIGPGGQRMFSADRLVGPSLWEWNCCFWSMNGSCLCSTDA